MLCAQNCIQIAKHCSPYKSDWMTAEGWGNSWSLLIHLPHKRDPTVSTSQIQPFIYNFYTSPQGQSDSLNYHQWPSRTQWKFLKIFSHGLCSWHFIYNFWQINSETTELDDYIFVINYTTKAKPFIWINCGSIRHPKDNIFLIHGLIMPVVFLNSIHFKMLTSKYLKLIKE